MKIFFTASAVMLSLFLGGCSNVRGQLGLEKEAPDEFAVITRAPLEMPSELVLPPPRPGVQRPQESAPEQSARAAVFGNSSQDGAKADASSGESALLQKTAQEGIDPNIRDTIDAEAEQMKGKNKTVAQKLLGLGSKTTEPSADVVDAKAEAERIQKNTKEGKPVTEGQTPLIEQ